MPIDNQEETVRLTAAATIECGAFVIAPDGRVGVSLSMKPVLSGQVAVLKIEGRAFGTASGAMSAGAIVGVHIANQTVVAAGTAGSVPAGTLLYDVADGAEARFDLNEYSGRDVSIGASTAAAGTTTADAGALPAGTARVYPTTAADDTKGVIISATDNVTGRQLNITNGVSNKILKVYPPTGGTINGAAANAAFSSASGKGVIAVCVSGSGNTWAAW